MKKYLKAQIKKIEIDKWCEGTELKKDPGKEYILDWINNNAVNFREAWEGSICKNCCLSESCGYLVVQHCEKFQSDNNN